MATPLSRSQVEALIEELREAADVYYQRLEEPLLSDEEFDAKIAFLGTLALQEPLADLFEVGTPGFLLLEGDPSLGTTPQGASVVHHKAPMLSLAKAKDVTTLERFLRKVQAAGGTSFGLQAKLDGFALSARYEDGALTLLATRGDGEVGEDVTYIIEAPQVTILGLPRRISLKTLTEVRGELYMTDSQFRAADAARVALGDTPFKNSRNAVVGLMKKAKLGVAHPVELTFGAYSVMHEQEADELKSLRGMGFYLVDEVTQDCVPSLPLSDLKTIPEVLVAVEAFGKARPSLPIPTDGVVLKATNEGEMHRVMGFASHHPHSQLAYKYPAEAAETTIVGFTVTTGRTGRVTPTAMLEPVMLSGIRIVNASCHNFNWVAERDVRVGSRVTVYRANDVIPQVQAVLANPEGAQALETPTHCSSCGTLLSFDAAGPTPPKVLTCENLTCEAKVFSGLELAAGRSVLDIDGLAVATLTFLYESGRVKTPADFFTLTQEELSEATCGYSEQGNPRRLGEKRAAHILEHVEKAKTLPLWRLMGTLNIPLLGGRASKELVKAFGTMERIRSLTAEEIAAVPGFGAVKGEKIAQGLAIRGDLIDAMAAQGVVWDSAALEAGDAPLEGLSFAISGEVPPNFPNRGAWVELLESRGATFHSAPKAGTTFMVGDPQGTSSKAKKALALGVEFISPEEFTSRFAS